jgi:hypothetical protein
MRDNYGSISSFGVCEDTVPGNGVRILPDPMPVGFRGNKDE